MKMIKCNKPATCGECKKDIKKGDLYRRQSKRIGSYKRDSLEMRDGIPHIICNGITIAVKLCSECAVKKGI